MQPLAEITTNEALSWAVYLNMLSTAPAGALKLYEDLSFTASTEDIQLLNSAPLVSQEASAENNKVDVKACLALRGYFNERSDLLKFNDKRYPCSLSCDPCRYV